MACLFTPPSGSLPAAGSDDTHTPPADLPVQPGAAAAAPDTVVQDAGQEAAAEDMALLHNELAIVEREKAALEKRVSLLEGKAQETDELLHKAVVMLEKYEEYSAHQELEQYKTRVSRTLLEKDRAIAELEKRSAAAVISPVVEAAAEVIKSVAVDLKSLLENGHSRDKPHPPTRLFGETLSWD